MDEIPTTRKPLRALLHGLSRWGAAAGPWAGHGHPGRFAHVPPGDDVSGGQGNPRLFESGEDLLMQPIWVCLCPKAAARRWHLSSRPLRAVLRASSAGVSDDSGRVPIASGALGRLRQTSHPMFTAGSGW